MERLFGEDNTTHLYEADDYGVDVVPGGAGAYQVEEGDEDDITDLEALIAATSATGGDWSDVQACFDGTGTLLPTRTVTTRPRA